MDEALQYQPYRRTLNTNDINEFTMRISILLNYKEE